MSLSFEWQIILTIIYCLGFYLSWCTNAYEASLLLEESQWSSRFIDSIRILYALAWPVVILICIILFILLMLVQRKEDL